MPDQDTLTPASAAHAAQVRKDAQGLANTYHEKVAAKLIEQLKQGAAPWQKPLIPGQISSLLPYNPTTGASYRGINMISLMAEGRADPRWMTYKQASAFEGQVRKGEKGTTIQFWSFTETRNVLDPNGKPVLDDEGQIKQKTVHLDRPRVRFATVFNAAQIEGLTALEKPVIGSPTDTIERANTLLAASGATIKHDQHDRCFYRPSTDTIHLPAPERFKGETEYYQTAFHELGHWSGHASRLDRDMAHPFGSEGYAKEELRAEIASLMISQELNLGFDPSQHTSYVGSWIKVLQDDPREIFRAASAAEQIRGYVMGILQQQTQSTAQDAPDAEGHQTSVPTPSEDRHYLSVPYAEKSQVKALGARWDRVVKAWYVPPGVDAGPFDRWADPPHRMAQVKENQQIDARLQAIARNAHGIVDGASGTGDLVANSADEDFDSLQAIPPGRAQRTQAWVLIRQSASLNTAYELQMIRRQPDFPNDLAHSEALEAKEGDDALQKIMQTTHTFQEAKARAAPVEPAAAAILAGKDLTALQSIPNASGHNAFRIDLVMDAMQLSAALNPHYDQAIARLNPAVAASMRGHEAHRENGATIDHAAQADKESRLKAVGVMTQSRIMESPTVTLEERRDDHQVALSLRSIQDTVTLLRSTAPGLNGPADLGAQLAAEDYAAYRRMPAGRRESLRLFAVMGESAALNGRYATKLRELDPVTAEAAKAAFANPATESASEPVTAGRPVRAAPPAAPRSYLTVPYAEREQARAAGARWDAAAKAWYVGPKADHETIARWESSTQATRAPIADPRAEFAAVLRDAGAEVSGDHPIMDGAKHRIAVAGDKGGERSGFYVARIDDIRPAAYFMNHRTREELRWKAKGYTLTHEQKAQLAATADAKLKERQAEQQTRQEKCAERVTKQCAELRAISAEAPLTPYMESKGLKACSGVFTDAKSETLFVPVIDIHGKQWSQQTIGAQGAKRFAKDGRKEGCFHPVGGIDTLKDAKVFVIAEGFATAATIHQTLDSTVAVATIAAFDCGNLVAVAKALRTQYPNTPIIIAGDDDRARQEKEGINPGREAALEAAGAVNGVAAFPTFHPGDPAALSDFNDLVQQSTLGAEALQRQLYPVVALASGVEPEGRKLVQELKVTRKKEGPSLDEDRPRRVKRSMG